MEAPHNVFPDTAKLVFAVMANLALKSVTNRVTVLNPAPVNPLSYQRAAPPHTVSYATVKTAVKAHNNAMLTVPGMAPATVNKLLPTAHPMHPKVALVQTDAMAHKHVRKTVVPIRPVNVSGAPATTLA